MSAHRVNIQTATILEHNKTLSHALPFLNTNPKCRVNVTISSLTEERAQQREHKTTQEASSKRAIHQTERQTEDGAVCFCQLLELLSFQSFLFRRRIACTFNKHHRADFRLASKAEHLTRPAFTKKLLRQDQPEEASLKANT